MQSYYVTSFLFGRPLPGDRIEVQNDHQAIGFALAVYRLLLGGRALEDMSAVHVYRAPPVEDDVRYFSREAFVASWRPVVDPTGDTGVMLIHPGADARDLVAADLEVDPLWQGSGDVSH